MEQPIADSTLTNPPRPRRRRRLDFPLTPCEMNVAVLVCEGLSNRQIAERTGRAESTIDQQRMMARLKLGARSTAALIHAMIAKKLWSPT